MYKTKHYVVTETGTDLYLKWLEAMKDTNAKVAVVGRVGRIEVGNLAITNFVVTVFGNCRLMLGQASSLYYAIAGNQVVWLLCGGDKQTQDADIDRACAYWQQWKKESQQRARETMIMQWQNCIKMIPFSPDKLLTPFLQKVVKENCLLCCGKWLKRAMECKLLQSKLTWIRRSSAARYQQAETLRWAVSQPSSKLLECGYRYRRFDCEG